MYEDQKRKIDNKITNKSHPYILFLFQTYLHFYIFFIYPFLSFVVRNNKKTCKYEYCPIWTSHILYVIFNY